MQRWPTVRHLWLLGYGLLPLLTTAASTSLYIHNGTVVNADRQFRAHVLVHDGKISAVGPDVQVCDADAPCRSLHLCKAPKTLTFERSVYDAYRRLRMQDCLTRHGC